MIAVFLGPSLSWSVARTLIRAEFRPPARQGDVFAAIDDGASAIVLIDGVFDSQPSVWHHELIAAKACGLRVFGASSMGALRAAELPDVVEPLGEIAQRYASGEWNDDAHVALLHGDQGSGFRALSVPWVNVFASLREARELGEISARAQRTALEREAARFYQLRTRRRVAAELPVIEQYDVNLKAHDARVALGLVEKLRVEKQLGRGEVRATRFSSFVRRERLARRGVKLKGGTSGLRTLLLADLARTEGKTPDAKRVVAWRKKLREPAADLREAWAEALALEEVASGTLAEYAARAGIRGKQLEKLVLSAPDRFVCDGPSLLEGAALENALG
ncbi:MAG: TfuA-like protein [Archangium sp.]